MVFICIMCYEKDFKAIKENICNNNKDIELIFVQDSNISNLQNVKFDCFIIHEQILNLKNICALEKILKNLKYLIINSDKNTKLDILNSNKINVITYGLNHKCTVTASSIQDDSIMIALQREILNKYGKLYEISEKKIEVNKDLDIYSYMLIFIIEILYCKNVEY